MTVMTTERTTMATKLSRLIEVTLNGSEEAVDPAVRRTLYALGDELENRHDETMTELRGVRRLLIGLTTTTGGMILAGVANILLAV